MTAANTIIPRREWPAIARTVAANGWGAMTDLAAVYGVSRERIRQICKAEGVTINAVMRAQRAERDAYLARVAGLALDKLAAERTLSVPALAAQLRLTAVELHRVMRAHDPEAWARWAEPSRGPARTWWGGRCSRCGEWKAWADMGRGSDRPSGRVTRCKRCVSLDTAAAMARRNVTEPLVTEKRCPRCKLTKPRAAYYRSRHQLDGLQTYCIDCNKLYRQGIID